MIKAMNLREEHLVYGDCLSVFLFVLALIYECGRLPITSLGITTVMLVFLAKAMSYALVTFLSWLYGYAGDDFAIREWTLKDKTEAVIHGVAAILILSYILLGWPLPIARILEEHVVFLAGVFITYFVMDAFLLYLFLLDYCAWKETCMAKVCDGGFRDFVDEVNDIVFEFGQQKLLWEIWKAGQGEED